MSNPLVSVVIPAYNQASYLVETIQSVLDQTYDNLEVIVVNDASPDNTNEVVQTFSDPRVKLIVHKSNKGLPASRNTGINASTGDLIALLDADDLFLPEKVQRHVDFFDKHPEVGVTYNARFELNHSSDTIREIWRPPKEVCLLDVVLGFPFSPSDMIIRREWLFRVGLFDESFIYGGEDTDLPCRLALEGCQFARIDKVLNLRRYHSGRKRKNLLARLEDVKRALDATFKDPRCTQEVLAVKDKALEHHLMVLVSLAFMQEETPLAHKFLGDLAAVDASVLEGNPSELVNFLLLESISDENADHEVIIKTIERQLTDEYAWMANQLEVAIARGYLFKGIRALMFGRNDVGKDYLEIAARLNASIDKTYLHNLSYEWVSYDKEFGAVMTREMINRLSPYLFQFGNLKDIRWLKGNYFINKAFQDYEIKNYRFIPGNVMRSIFVDPRNGWNRGVMKIFFKSLLNVGSH